MPGIEDPDRLTGVLDVWATNGPLLAALPMRRMYLMPAGVAVRATVALVVVPSLAVRPQDATYSSLTTTR